MPAAPLTSLSTALASGWGRDRLGCFPRPGGDETDPGACPARDRVRTGRGTSAARRDHSDATSGLEREARTPIRTGERRAGPDGIDQVRPGALGAGPR